MQDLPRKTPKEVLSGEQSGEETPGRGDPPGDVDIIREHTRDPLAVLDRGGAGGMSHMCGKGASWF